ncbi:hypothetical protein [Palleronia sp.]|uniref:hypothetical protein n=1 Tax=Palleronia sp. TaxID=1940284 RepID=UPI0035C8748B
MEVQNMYRELFGSTLMLVDDARWDSPGPSTSEETRQRFLRAFPPIHGHCETFTEMQVDSDSGKVALGDKMGECAIELVPHPDGLWDIHVRKPGVQADEVGLTQNVVLLKLLAYDCGPAGSLHFDDDYGSDLQE